MVRGRTPSRQAKTPRRPPGGRGRPPAYQREHERVVLSRPGRRPLRRKRIKVGESVPSGWPSPVRLRRIPSRNRSEQCSQVCGPAVSPVGRPAGSLRGTPSGRRHVAQCPARRSAPGTEGSAFRPRPAGPLPFHQSTRPGRNTGRVGFTRPAGKPGARTPPSGSVTREGAGGGARRIGPRRATSSARSRCCGRTRGCRAPGGRSVPARLRCRGCRPSCRRSRGRRGSPRRCA